MVALFTRGEGANRFFHSMVSFSVLNSKNPFNFNMFKAVCFFFFILQFNPAIAQQPPSSPRENANALIKENRLDPAKKILNEILINDPQNLSARLELARLHSKMEKWDPAISEYEKVLASDPENLEIQEEYAWTLLQGSRFEKAIKVYDRLLKENPAAIDLHLRKALALYGAARIPEAISEYKKVLKLDPFNIEAEIAILQLKDTVPQPFQLKAGMVLSFILMLVLTSLLVMGILRSRASRKPSKKESQSLREERYIRAIAIIGLMVATYYIFWRITYTMNWDAWWFSIPVLGAEVYGLAVAYLFFFMVWKPTQRKAPPPPPNRTVDVFVATYDEDPNILRKTIVGCLEMTYPHKTYILDDGNRTEVARLAQDLGCVYITREKNINAKAGNLNNALRQTSGEFIVTFDADHVPLPNFLEKLLGYFEDPKVSFVQTPQDFYNVDSFQHRLNPKRRRMWTEQSLFFSVIQPGKDHWNSAFYCGSCAILRRSALEEIGGFAEATVTEDIHTSILLHGKGFKSIYHTESLAYGLAPETALPFQIQRLRWGQGAMQVMVRDNPIWKKGLTLSQRFSYFASMTTYFDGFQKLIFYLAPIVYFLTGILPINAFDIVFLLHFIPYFIIFLLSFELMSRGRGSVLVTEQYNMAKFATFMKSSLGLFRKKPLKFHITPKSGTKEEGLGLFYPQILVLTLSFIGVVLGMIRYNLKGDLEPLAFYGNLLWAFLNAGLALAIIRFSRKKHQHRSAFRFLFLLPCVYHPINKTLYSPQIGLVRDCHEDGASLFTSHPLEQGIPIHVTMSVGNRSLDLDGVVITADKETQEGPSVFRNGIRFTHITPEDQSLLIKYSFEYSIPKFMETYAQPNTLFNQLEDFLRQDQRRKRRWTFSLPTKLRFNQQIGEKEILAVTEDISEGGLSIVSSEELPLGILLNFSIELSDQQIQGKGRTSRGESHPFGHFQIYRYVIQFHQLENRDLAQIRQIKTLVSMAQGN